MITNNCFAALCASNIDPEDAIASIDAMRLQEERAYLTSPGFFEQHHEEQSCRCSQNGSINSMIPVPSTSSSVDVECRSRMTEWCYQLSDFCNFNRETVEIAISYLDRCCSTAYGRSFAFKDRRSYQLTAMTCLYTACKINEYETITPKLVAGLSRGAYTEQQVVDMERFILKALQWRMNPPTALSFVRLFFDLAPPGSMTEQMKIAALDLVRFQTEVAVNEYSLASANASTIAFASIANALEGQPDLFEEHMKEYFLENLSNIASIQRHSQQMQTTQQTLIVAMSKTKLIPSVSVTSTDTNSNVASELKHCQQHSPRSVVSMAQHQPQ